MDHMEDSGKPGRLTPADRRPMKSTPGLLTTYKCCFLPGEKVVGRKPVALLMSNPWELPRKRKKDPDTCEWSIAKSPTGTTLTG